MTRLAGVALLSLLGVSLGVSPVQKVVELLQENRVKIVDDLKAEETEMAEYTTYCDNEASERGYAIETAGRKIMDLTAAIEDGEAKIVSFKDEIATLGSEAAAKEGQLAEATAERKAEKAEFEASEKELVGSLDQLTRAVTIIKREMSFVQMKGVKGKVAKRPTKDIKTALSMIAKVIDASWVEAGTRKSLKALLQTKTGAEAEEDDDLTLKQPQAKVVAYESSSGGIVEQIEEMKQKAEETLSTTRSTEMKETHNFDMMAQSLTDAIKNLNERISIAKSSLATTTEEMSKAKAELTETKKSKAADEAFSASLKQDCDNAARMWEERQASAKGEMAAIDKAKEILTAGVRVFVQTNVKTHGDDDGDDRDDDEDKQTVARHKVMAKLKDLSKTYKSYALMEMVSAARSDPFEKVRGLIESMIDKLITEANEEATQKAFCDEEMSKSKATQEEKSMTSDKLQSRLDKAATSKAQLEQSVKTLEAEIAAIDAGTAEATKIRTEEHATYLKASADFKDAAEAVTQAIHVLKEYYEGALIQTKTSEKKSKQPEFGGAKSDSAHSILSILEMSAEDFTKLYMDEEGKETESSDEYKKLMQESKVSKASKQAEVKGDLSEIKSLDVSLENNKEDLDMTSKELDAVLAYIEKLKPQCETKVMSYAEKKARREAEIEGLKEALSILDGSAPALLQLRGTRKH
jgi:chromosome segregation ATPase